jgi:Holliday junction resolvasome RuvABC endonuclease subunit
MSANDLTRVLAIDPTTNGFGFVVMEGPESLIDWGVRIAGRDDKNDRCLKLVSALIDIYRPDVLVVEELRTGRSRRSQRVQELIDSIANLASERNVKTRRFSSFQIRRNFSESAAANKEQIATAIANRFPELAPRVPQHRFAWMSEHYNMAVFDAVSLALTYFYFKDRKQNDGLSALGINSSNHA